LERRQTARGGSSYGHRHKAASTENFVTFGCVVREIGSRTDRQTHTDMLITLLYRGKGITFVP